jgi:hypothetical protein
MTAERCESPPLSNEELGALAGSTATRCGGQTEADAILAAATGRYRQALAEAFEAEGFAVSRRCFACEETPGNDCQSLACDQGEIDP